MTDSVPDPFKPSNPDNDFIRRIRLIEGDLTLQQDVDAIATSMDITLDTSRHLNRSIIAAAGEALDASILENIYRSRVGDVHVLPGYNLPAKNILIAVTPIWRPGIEGEDRDLLRCYRSLLEMAERMGIESLAIPALGTGKNQFPVPRAARLAIQAIRERMPENLQELRIVCNKKETYDAFAERLRLMES